MEVTSEPSWLVELLGATRYVTTLSVLSFPTNAFGIGRYQGPSYTQQLWIVQRVADYASAIFAGFVWGEGKRKSERFEHGEHDAA